MEVEGQWKASSGFEKKHLVGTSLGGAEKIILGDGEFSVTWIRWTNDRTGT